MENNRWWENYLVRYLIGTIFSFFMIFELTKAGVMQICFNTGLKESIHELFLNSITKEPQLLFISGILSFAFCYF